MALFLDTVNLDEVKEFYSWGIISGVTTNPKILSLEKSSYEYKARIKEIITIVKAPVSVELTEESLEGMLVQAREFSSWDKAHIVIKVPMGPVGLKVVKVLEAEGIGTNVTVVMSFNQAYLACAAGATYVSIFSGRIKDMGYEPLEVISDTREMIDREALRTKIIVGSIRHYKDVSDALLAGAHIVTVPPAILKNMPHNPGTDATCAEFNAIWNGLKKEKKVR